LVVAALETQELVKEPTEIPQYFLLLLQLVVAAVLETALQEAELEGQAGGQIATTQQTRGLEPQTKDSQEAKQKLVVIVRLEEGAALVR
jgi:hypothetical protein